MLIISKFLRRLDFACLLFGITMILNLALSKIVDFSQKTLNNSHKIVSNFMV